MDRAKSPETIQMALARLFDTDLFARAKAWSTSSRHESLAQRAAGAAFLIRFVSAAFLYLSQVFFARWIGESEFGIYVYAWTWVQLLGDVLHLGLSTAAQRYIPRYIQQNAWELLRGLCPAVVGSSYRARPWRA